jgi:hypothetical protein
MQAGYLSWIKSHSAKLFGFLGFLGLVALCLFFIYFWLVITERIGTFHHTTEVADLDGDGDLDVLLHNVRKEGEFTAFGGPTLWFNQGDGGFVPRRYDGVPGEGGGWASALGDVDQDGDLDLFVFSGWFIRLVLNMGGTQGGQTGEYKVNNVVSAPQDLAQFGSILVGDLDNDGRVDSLVVGCCDRAFTLDPNDDTPNTSWMWINDWAIRGRLAPLGWTLSALDGLALRAAALGDLDSDGDLDLFGAVIASRHSRYSDPADRLLINDGSGSFSDSGQRLGKTDSTAVALGDLDGDSDLDALVGTAKGVVIWLNQGGMQAGQEGTFVLSGQEISGSKTGAAFLSDLDRDGDLDALIARPRQADLWWNDGAGAFTPSRQHFRYTKRHGLAIGDFNNDKQPDIFAAEYNTDYRLWFNQGDGTFR